MTEGNRAGPAGQERLNITDVEQIASYNLLDDDGCNMLVPGMPPVWSPPKSELKILPDQGPRFVEQDHNAGRCPSSPMEPLVRAVLHQQPFFNFSGLDLITDRWPLNELLRYFGLSKEAHRKNLEDFAFGAQIAGNVIVFFRHDPVRREILSENDFRGFRSDFDKKYFEYRADCANSASHYIIITYRFGGLKIMLRHKVNGFFAERAPQAMIARPAVEVGHMGPGAEIFDHLTVRTAGFSVPIEAHIELTTKRKMSSLNSYRAEEVPQQWLSQTPNFIRAPLSFKWKNKISHMRAVVAKKDIDIRDATADVDQWVDDHQNALRAFAQGLAGLIAEIRQRSLDGEGSVFLVQHLEGSSLSVLAKTIRDLPALPTSLTQRIGEFT